MLILKNYITLIFGSIVLILSALHCLYNNNGILSWSDGRQYFKIKF